jgi:hypothetical protein
VTDIFKDKTPMPPGKESMVVSTAMCREETPIGTPVLSGEVKYPNDVERVSRPRRGHAY